MMAVRMGDVPLTMCVSFECVKSLELRESERQVNSLLQRSNFHYLKTNLIPTYPNLCVYIVYQVKFGLALVELVLSVN